MKSWPHIVVWLCLSLSQAHGAEQPTAAADYDVLHGGDGCGFVARYKGTDYCVSSTEQFEGKIPGFTGPNGEPVSLMPGPTFRLTNVQAWVLKETRPFLPHNGVFTLLYGEKVQVIAPGRKRIFGELEFRLIKYNSRFGTRPLALRIAPSDLPPILRGAPVCKMDGTVIGVVTEIDPDKGRVLLETFSLENPLEEMNRESPLDAYYTRSFKTLSVQDGPTYTGVKIRKARRSGIHIIHDEGAAEIEPRKLTSAQRRKLISPTIWEVIEFHLTEQDFQKLGPVLTAQLVASEAGKLISELAQEKVWLSIHPSQPGQARQDEGQKLWGDAVEACYRLIREISAVVAAEDELEIERTPRFRLAALKKVEAAYQTLALNLEQLAAMAVKLRGDSSDPQRLSAADILEGNIQAIQVFAVEKREPAVRKEREDLERQLGEAK